MVEGVDVLAHDRWLNPRESTQVVLILMAEDSGAPKTYCRLWEVFSPCFLKRRESRGAS